MEVVTTFVDVLRTTPWFLIACTGLLGLLVGSFLNVVIYRLPLMIEQACEAERREARDQPPLEPESLVTLAHPPSRCPGCESPVKPWQNIPIASWVLLKGSCASCKAPISIQYPLVEAAACALAAACAWHFGWGTALLPSLILCWLLLALAMIDAQTQLLPDALTTPLLWIGLLAAVSSAFVPASTAILGALAGYVSLAVIHAGFMAVTGREGMGEGDFKLFSALGAWLGWMALPGILMIAATLCSLWALLTALRKGGTAPVVLAFGPFLSIAGIVWLFAGGPLLSGYLHLLGLQP